jgi:hypothetical protein
MMCHVARLSHVLCCCALLLHCLPQGGKPVWQLLLDFALQHKLHALLDCGALLAGTTNRWVATPH